MDKSICVQILLPALENTEEQKTMTDKALKSLIAIESCVKVTVDKEKYDTKVAGVWNHFLDQWRGLDYDYLMITANDVIHDPCCIDYLVRCAEENPNAGIISTKCIRDFDAFQKGFGQNEYTSRLTGGLKDPATFLIRKGVIEKVGRIDEYFPVEFVERDYIYRCKLAGYDWVQPDVVLEYHPPRSGTVGNDEKRLQEAYRRYVSKWNGDANSERWEFPMNDFSNDYTFCVK